MENTERVSNSATCLTDIQESWLGTD